MVILIGFGIDFERVWHGLIERWSDGVLVEDLLMTNGLWLDVPAENYLLLLGYI